MRACFAANDPKWNCRKWIKETPDIKSLPNKLSKELYKRKKASKKK